MSTFNIASDFAVNLVSDFAANMVPDCAIDPVSWLPLIPGLAPRPMLFPTVEVVNATRILSRFDPGSWVNANDPLRWTVRPLLLPTAEVINAINTLYVSAEDDSAGTYIRRLDPAGWVLRPLNLPGMDNSTHALSRPLILSGGLAVHPFILANSIRALFVPSRPLIPPTGPDTSVHALSDSRDGSCASKAIVVDGYVSGMYASTRPSTPVSSSSIGGPGPITPASSPGSTSDTSTISTSTLISTKTAAVPAKHGNVYSSSSVAPTARFSKMPGVSVVNNPPVQWSIDKILNGDLSGLGPFPPRQKMSLEHIMNSDANQSVKATTSGSSAVSGDHVMSEGAATDLPVIRNGKANIKSLSTDLSKVVIGKPTVKKFAASETPKTRSSKHLTHEASTKTPINQVATGRVEKVYKKAGKGKKMVGNDDKQTGDGDNTGVTSPAARQERPSNVKFQLPVKTAAPIQPKNPKTRIGNKAAARETADMIFEMENAMESYSYRMQRIANLKKSVDTRKRVGKE